MTPTFTIKIIETETGDVLTKAETDNMLLPFTFGWASWGIFDENDQCLDSFPRYSQAAAFATELNPVLALAA